MRYWKAIVVSFGIGFLCALSQAIEDARVARKYIHPYVKNVWDKAYSPRKKSSEFVTDLLVQAEGGDLTLKSQLNFFRVLDLDKYSDDQLLEVETTARGLINATSEFNVASAHTTLGFLLRHNLITSKTTSQLSNSKNTEFNMTNRALSFTNDTNDSLLTPEQEALEHFAQGADLGDPLAQIIMGNYYSSHHNCRSAVEMYRRAAVEALSTVKDSTYSRVKFGPFVDQYDYPSNYDHLTEDEFTFLMYLADSGDPNAALQVAVAMLGDLVNVKYDPINAAKYLEIAIDAEISNAMVFMAHLHMEGEVPSPDLAYARRLLEKALDLGNLAAQAAYARFYYEGLNDTPQDLQVARSLLMKGAEAGYLDSQFRLGQLIAVTSKSMNDRFLALQYWQLPAMRGHVHSSWYMAEYLDLSLSGVLGKSNLSSVLCETCLSYYRSVAQAGEWHNLLYAAYKDFEEKRYDAAALKYTLLSDLDYEAAHINLARLLQKQLTTIPRDEYEVWKLAADHNNPNSVLELAHLNYFGSGGLSRSNKMHALSLYEKAAMLGNSEAMFSLAYMLEWGDGVDQNIQEALNAYNLAATMSDDAYLPVLLASSRLQVYQFVNETFGVDLYELDFVATAKSMQTYLLLPEVIVGILIILIYLRLHLLSLR